MLVLGRQVGSEVLIVVDGKECWVQVVSVRGDHVKLGFSAPREIRVLRGELVGNNVDEVA